MRFQKLHADFRACCCAKWKNPLGFAVLACVLFAIPPAARAQQGVPYQWTWMGGSSTIGQPAAYGILGVPAPQNVPGGRWSPASWMDSNGNFWLFGGQGYDVDGNAGYLNDLWELNPSTNQWTWIGGSSTVGGNGGQTGVYGTLGVSAAANMPGGRQEASSWTDGSGHFWLFGGQGYDARGHEGWLNDLWEFDPATRQWTWRSGSSTLGSYCNGDANQCGYAGTYGSLGVPSANDTPASLWGASSWVDRKSQLWLFGGVGYGDDGNGSWLNNLWGFNSTTNLWTWRSGSRTQPCCYAAWARGQAGVYDTLGVPSGAGSPGSRHDASRWTDSSGNFWLFGGQGLDGSGNLGSLNDLWKFNPSTSEWTWRSGSSTVPTTDGVGRQPGVYGTPGTPSAANAPGGRWGATGWTDSNGNLWLFGGWTNTKNDSASPYADTGKKFADLWEFQPSTNEWTWMGGGSGTDASGVYGVPGTATAGTTPGARWGTAQWSDSSGNLWLFGGYGIDASGNAGLLNDLWRYQTQAAPSTSTALISSRNPQLVTMPVTFTEIVTNTVTNSVPSGNLTFFDGSSPLGIVSLDTTGTATLTTSALSVGAHPITAYFASPTGAFQPSVSAVLMENIVAYFGDFSITASPLSQTLYTGEAAVFQATLVPLAGWTQAVTMSCGPLPANTTCTFTPETIAGATGTATLLIQTTAPQQVALAQPSDRLPWNPDIALGMASMALCFFPFLRRSYPFAWRQWVMATTVVFVFGSLTACGANPVAGGTPPGTYVVSISATFLAEGQTLVHSAPVTLVVKSLF